MSNIIQKSLSLLNPIRWQAWSSQRTICTSGVLFAEPPRKKRRMDPALLKIRVERKMNKLRVQIDKLEKAPRQLAPILEYQYNNSDIRDLEARPGRQLEDVGLSTGVIRAANRLWNFYRLQESIMQKRSIRRVEAAQTGALETLKKIDENLYNKTVANDELTLIPYISSHLRKETCPNPEYATPDGNIKDISKNWIM